MCLSCGVIEEHDHMYIHVARTLAGLPNIRSMLMIVVQLWMSVTINLLFSYGSVYLANNIAHIQRVLRRFKCQDNTCN